MSLSSDLMALTTAGSTGRRSGVSTVVPEPTVLDVVLVVWAATRCQSFGPEAARKTSWALKSSYQSTLMFIHGTSPLTGPVTTAGWKDSGVTISDPLTS